MKSLLVLAKSIFVGAIWSIFYFDGMRIIMLKNWRFDIFNSEHWAFSWNLWLDGWVIDEPREWAFVIIVITLVPLWLTGWTALCLFKWENLFYNIFITPLLKIKALFSLPVLKVKPKVKKKISYKKVRPKSVRPASSQGSSLITTGAFDATGASLKPRKKKKPVVMEQAPSVKEENKAMNHSIFDIDDDDDDDFNIDLIGLDDDDFVEEEKPKKKPNNQKNNSNKNKKENNNNQNKKKNNNNNNQKETGIFGILNKKGYNAISSIQISGELIDFIGISNEKIQLCLIDKEAGDWLADEERFNDEEPLWFSESSHRTSPVRLALNAKEAIEKAFVKANLNYSVETNVIIQAGNIINAEDMIDTWEQLGVNVSRIDRGGPDELKSFINSVDSAEGNIPKPDSDKVKKLIRSLA